MHKQLCLLIFGAAFLNAAYGQQVDSSTFAFCSDTQAPMWVESLWLKKHQNKTATARLFDDMAERRPGSVFILGDVVNLGYSNRQWKPMDDYLSQLRSRGISVHAVLGNHEVMGRAKKGQQKFQQRFPDHLPTGYVKVKDSVAVVLLNSNFSKLSPEQDAEQVAWYRRTLQALDQDPGIVFIITGCHHSPYTNSKIVKPSEAVQEKFVSAFLQSQKSRLFVSGHCHGFEHYRQQGKDFLVIGGGGGLHQPLKNDNDALADLASDYKPLFHYITVKRQGQTLSITSYRINQKYNGFEPGLALSLEAPVKHLAARAAGYPNATAQ